MAKKTKISHQIKKKPITFKQNALSTTAQMMKDSQAVILTEYRGLTVPQVNDIRGKLKDSGADFSVIKNTLFKNDPEGCAVLFANGAPAPNARCELPSFTTVDLTFRWKAMDKVEVLGSAQNITNQIAPLDPLTYGAVSYNPLDYAGAVGRTFNLGVRYSF